ncbi:hypothetical protein A6A26_11425 [Pantoea sp. OXWO6B1]|nr:hypothetical protein A6A26_11425 [Pantoea sp. OXWO6B1]
MKATHVILHDVIYRIFDEADPRNAAICSEDGSITAFFRHGFDSGSTQIYVTTFALVTECFK